MTLTQFIVWLTAGIAGSAITIGVYTDSSQKVAFGVLVAVMSLTWEPDSFRQENHQ